MKIVLPAAVAAAMIGWPALAAAQGGSLSQSGGGRGSGLTTQSSAPARPPGRPPTGTYRPRPSHPQSGIAYRPGFFPREFIRSPYFFGYFVYDESYDTWLWSEPRYAGSGGEELMGPGPQPAESSSGPPPPTGGLQLAIEPQSAQVWVDGYYAGTVGDFSGYYHHLELTAGAHSIAIVAPGYELLVFDQLITPSRTTTYRGILGRAPGR